MQHVHAPLCRRIQTSCASSGPVLSARAMGYHALRFCCLQRFITSIPTFRCPGCLLAADGGGVDQGRKERGVGHTQQLGGGFHQLLCVLRQQHGWVPLLAFLGVAQSALDVAHTCDVECNSQWHWIVTTEGPR